eukprot:Partr_v1_DN27993_c1_g1_i8_m11157 putative ZW10, kinetochore associated, homolog (Drosophila)
MMTGTLLKYHMIPKMVRLSPIVFPTHFSAAGLFSRINRPNSEKSKSGGKSSKGESFVESFLILPKCQISLATQAVIELAYQTVAGYDSMDALLQKESVECSLDIFNLWRAMQMNIHGSDISESPRRLALFYNDCLYINHHLTFFGLELKLEEERGKHAALSFITLIPLFRTCANEAFCSFLNTQKQAVVGYAEAFQKSPSLCMFESALDNLLKRSCELSKSWKMVLPRKAFLTTLGSLIDKFLAEMGNVSGFYHALEQDERWQVDFLVKQFLQRLDKLFSFADVQEPIAKYASNMKTLVFIS